MFSAYDAVNGSELWVTDGTSAGTSLVKDIYSGSNSSGPTGFTALGDGRFLFSANDGTNGSELWVTDGTNAGTMLFKDINTTGTTDGPSGLTLITTFDTNRAGTVSLAGLTNGNAVEGTAIVASLTDADGVPVYTFSDVTDAANSVALQSGASASYTPGYADAGKALSVSVSYTDSQGHGEAPTASAGTVVNTDRAGTLSLAGLDASGNAVEGRQITATVTDPDGTPASASYTFTVGSSAAVTNTTGLFTPGFDTQGQTVSVSTAYTDGQGSAGTATASGGTVVDTPQSGGGGGSPPPAPSVITPGNDTITGTDTGSTTRLLAGDDVYNGGNGAELVYGNQGNDSLSGGAGQDTLYGGQNDDVERGGADADLVYGNLGNDLIYGNQGADTVYGGQGTDTALGG